MKEIYRAVARQAPLGQTLGEIVRLACESAGAGAGVVLGLKGEQLETLGWTGGVPPWLRPPAQTPVRAAPWWRLRGLAAEIGGAEWAPYVGLAGGARWCWSDRLTTAAGEIVGCLTLFCREQPREGRRWELIEELKELAVLAIEQGNLLEELRFRAEHDPVTGLWNRRRLEEELTGLREEGQAGAALVLVALDGARRVREILGEETGDALLREAAARLVRLPEAGFAARLSGDEVAVLAKAGAASPAEFGAKLLEALNQPFRVEGHEIHAHPAVGVTGVDGAAEA
ncbi:MAG: diguanylate cyclase domain-containing protein, partial [Bryobacteraceae bacterium]